MTKPLGRAKLFHNFVLASWLALTPPAAHAQENDVCSLFREACSVSCQDAEASHSPYDCSLPCLEELTPGGYEGITVNYLSFVTQASSPNFPIRAKEFEACTGNKIVFSDAGNIWEDPVKAGDEDHPRSRALRWIFYELLPFSRGLCSWSSGASQ